jgi:hypothetical protein
VKFADFQQIPRSKSVDDAIDSLADLECLSLGLLEPLLPEKGAPARSLAFVFDAGASNGDAANSLSAFQPT